MIPEPRPFPYHPLFFGLFPFLALWSGNRAQIVGPELALTALAALLVALLLYLVGWLIYRQAVQAAIFASLTLLVIFSYDHLRNGLAGLFGIPLSHRTSLTVCGAVLVVMMIVLRRSRRSFATSTRIFNVIGLLLVLIPGVQLVAYWWMEPTSIPQLAPTVPAPVSRVAGLDLARVAERARGKTLPDIYYIVPDRYASSGVLRDHCGFDNREFTDFLARRGFYRATRSHANYPKTYLSLASSLNFSYHDQLVAANGREGTDRQPYLARIANFDLIPLLRAAGYRYVHIGSRWPPTANNPNADLNLVYPVPLTLGFGWKLYATTALYPILERSLDLSETGFIRRRIVNEFRQLARVAPMPGPKFVFAHILLPHDPYVFGPNGEAVGKLEVRRRPEAVNYLNHVRYANRLLTEALTAILANSPTPPVIVLQSDEGPYLLGEYQGNGGVEGSAIDWRTLSDEALRVHLEIINAYYFPDGNYAGLDPEITPVNTFRVIANRYLGTDLPRLPDRSFIIEDTRHPYAFVDVTDRLIAPSVAADSAAPPPAR